LTLNGTEGITEQQEAIKSLTVLSKKMLGSFMPRHCLITSIDPMISLKIKKGLD
jgi:hypothetical protein